MVRSKVWNHVSEPYSSPNGRKVSCKICSEELSFTGSTSNLRTQVSKQHNVDIPCLPPKGGKRKRTFEVHHESEVDLDESFSVDNPRTPKRPRISLPSQSPSTKSTSGYKGPLDKCINNINAFAVGGPRDAECTNALLFMIAKDYMPLRTTERQGFRVFVSTLQPLYKIPSEPVVTRLLNEKYSVLRKKVGVWLDAAENITLTMDLWTHRESMKGYLGVTSHFRRGKKQISIEVGARLVDQRKTKENLKVVMVAVCEDWKIPPNKVKTVVTDGGANIKAAAKEVFGVEKHVTCLAHQLNNIGQKVIGNSAPIVPSELEAVQPETCEDDEDENDQWDDNNLENNPVKCTIMKVKKIVRFFKQSEVASTKLRHLQSHELGKSDSDCLKLIQEVKTRWNSCFEMLDRYFVLAPLVTRTIIEVQRDRSSKAKPPILTPDDEDALKEVRDLLSPPARAITEISSEKLVTLSKCIPVVKSLRKSIEKFQPSTPVSFNMKEHILSLLHEKFGKMEEVPKYAAATLLDPRFKKVGFTDDMRGPIRVANAITFVSNLVKAKMSEAGASAAQAVEQQQQVADDDLWGDFDLEVQRHAAAVSGQDMAGGIPIRLRMYLDSAPVSRAENPDPLLVWDQLKGEYSNLFSVAQEYLSAIATSVPSECLFSHAGLIGSSLRTRLASKHLNMLVFLRSCDDSLWF